MKKQSKTKQASQADAISILESQHREVEELFEQFESACDEDDDETALAVAMQVTEKLTMHATIEEEIFYKETRTDENSDQLEEAAVEHLSVKRLIADIQKAEDASDRMKATVKVLKEQVEHHVEEEEGELFPQVKKEFSKEDLVSMGDRMSERMAELERGENGRPPASRKSSKSSAANV